MDRTPRAVQIDADGTTLDAELATPSSPHGIVVLAHGTGSGRLNPRNNYVADRLNRRGLATLLLDLLTELEERSDVVTAEMRFDTGLLTSRLLAACDFIAAQPSLRTLPIGLFGASTAAAAAIIAAAERPASIGAVVSRGGRPDMAGNALDRIKAPTLLIVGNLDYPVIELNEAALARLERIASRLEIVDSASHLFEEPGGLDQVADLAGEWFDRYLPRFRAAATAPMLRWGRERR